MKKIENIKNLDDIETQLKKDGYTFDNDEVVFEGMPDGIISEKDKIEFLKNSEIIYYDDKKVYGINIDELGDFEVVSYKIRREIQEFIDSTITTEFEAFDVEFKIVSNRNNEVYVEGHVTINDEEAEDVDWYFFDGIQYSSQRKIFHDGIATENNWFEQENEIAQFESDLVDDGIWIDDAILQSDEDENCTYVRENLTLIINEGDLNG